jgi:hypothetical protein
MKEGKGKQIPIQEGTKDRLQKNINHLFDTLYLLSSQWRSLHAAHILHYFKQYMLSSMLSFGKTTVKKINIYSYRSSPLVQHEDFIQNILSSMLTSGKITSKDQHLLLPEITIIASTARGFSHPSTEAVLVWLKGMLTYSFTTSRSAL